MESIIVPWQGQLPPTDCQKLAIILVGFQFVNDLRCYDVMSPLTLAFYGIFNAIGRKVGEIGEGKGRAWSYAAAYRWTRAYYKMSWIWPDDDRAKVA